MCMWQFVVCSCQFVAYREHLYRALMPCGSAATQEEVPMADLCRALSIVSIACPLPVNRNRTIELYLWYFICGTVTPVSP